MHDPSWPGAKMVPFEVLHAVVGVYCVHAWASLSYGSRHFYQHASSSPQSCSGQKSLEMTGHTWINFLGQIQLDQLSSEIDTCQTRICKHEIAQKTSLVFCAISSLVFCTFILGKCTWNPIANQILTKYLHRKITVWIVDWKWKFYP